MEENIYDYLPKNLLSSLTIVKEFGRKKIAQIISFFSRCELVHYLIISGLLIFARSLFGTHTKQIYSKEKM